MYVNWNLLLKIDIVKRRHDGIEFCWCLSNGTLPGIDCLWLQVFEVAPSVHMVELRKTGGDTLEFHKACENSLSLLLIQKYKSHIRKSATQI